VYYQIFGGRMTRDNDDLPPSLREEVNPTLGVDRLRVG
jgi:hypothetical protein